VSVRGRWEGKLADMSGPTALLVLDLKEDGTRVAGDFSISFLPPADDGCAAPDRRLAQTGTVEGTYDKKARRVSLRYELSIGLEPVVVALEGTLAPADPHARQALRGCYEIQQGRKTLTLDGGGCVLWQYGRPPRRKAAGGR
jgi:hypothetical protein